MRGKAVIGRDMCVACGVCMKTCSKGAIHIHHGCHAVVDEGKCVGCGKCTNACPAGCITIDVKEVLP